MKIALLQMNTTVGDIPGNVKKITEGYRRAVHEGAQVVVTPELAITGYPPRDLVYRKTFISNNLVALELLEDQMLKDSALVVGYIEPNLTGAGAPFFNAAAVLEAGKPISRRFKTCLPMYDVFDESRYFEPATSNEPVEILGHQVGVTICEDIWTSDFLPRTLYRINPVKHLASKKVSLILNLSASPYFIGKEGLRQKMLSAVAKETGAAIAYCNLVGGNDDLIFDGQSRAFNKHGHCIALGAAFKEDFIITSVQDSIPLSFKPGPIDENLFNALVLGLRDYVSKCGFRTVVLGLSGGIDSAVVAAIAAEAVGPSNVTGVSLPSSYSSQGSLDDARILAENLGINYDVVSIEEPFTSIKATMSKVFAGRSADLTEENMQARLRGVVLMSLSNKFGHMLLTTGNKSEMSVGYCTLYGDMCGGLSVISDVLKMQVYSLARWINERHGANWQKGIPIPADTLTKPPSAELRPDQKDQDSLPPYEVLDQILKGYVEENLSRQEIAAMGIDPIVVDEICRKVDFAEYKRKQAAPGLKVTPLAFGTGRRIPIAQKFKERL
ncbi:MAG: NAD+ synthase [Verrucomicrobiota bacterium]|nr:NAD+ synthase [Verrucomicrobiota bacterium]